MSQNNLHIISIELLKAKDKKAFEELYDKYSGALFSIILRIVNNTEAAEDVLQEGFLKIWRNIESFDSGKSTIFTWMLNICKNTAIDALRKNNSRPSIQTDTDNVSIQEINSTQTNVDLIGVKNSLKYLSTEQSLAIQAVYFTGLTHEEAAQELNIPLGTLKTRIRNGIANLKNVFKK
ncbi:MAG: sigma-70 family RNA polymerase sigma factor [Bacteroidetes bacterium]|nr:sigma-70 family RNA polymerase sigma factor [Bacteroidota bacterium]